MCSGIYTLYLHHMMLRPRNALRYYSEVKDGSGLLWLAAVSSLLLGQLLHLPLPPLQDLQPLGIVACPFLDPELLHVLKEPVPVSDNFFFSLDMNVLH